MHWLFTGHLRVDKLTVKITDLPVSLEGLKLVQLSDFHYDGLRLSDEMLEEAIALTNEAEPDVVVLTGDYVTDDPTPIHKLTQRLKYLESRYGVYAILGNHDIHYSHSKAEVTDAFTNIGVNVLWNEIAYPVGTELPFIGLADYWSREFQPAPIMNQLDSTTPRIVLSHNPDTAKILQQWRVDLQLSGHTHGGHIVIPGIGPLVFHYKKLLKKLPKKLRSWVSFFLGDFSTVVRYWEWAQGFHKVGSNQLYINRGLGTYRPGRLFCPPEVTVITLLRE
ncbi:metallophosphoesterase [Tolypothrix tenuis PCC 7101]|uniref:Metallophosphoesterase n=1 Tax=Tolypothrix tenuis PCC 7101 TaxID=231146 RepID=A0A1Z4MYD0_9CYAN|nr:metallophosphoesterase [Aulosira sp. FACHB-113]BAY98381.1 metallophosphoesterase [Tolypothrix tenuis PCC 7101]BAZ77700.1 metallophosphoesterase [Aulosira laxa NIES-50]